MSRSRNYQRSRRHPHEYDLGGLARLARRRFAALEHELDGVREYFDHMARGGRLEYGTPWALERALAEATYRNHRARRWASTRAGRRDRMRRATSILRSWGSVVLDGIRPIDSEV